MGTVNHILSYFPLTDAQEQAIKALLPHVTIKQVGVNTITQANVDAADTVFGNVPPQYLDAAPNLKWVHLSSAGTDGYLHLPKRGIVLTNGTGAYNVPIAEFMLALTGALCIRLPGYFRQQAAQVWARHSWPRTIEGSTVVVLGCGNIGTAYAKRMHDLGAYVIGVRRSAATCPEGVDEMVTMEQADEVLPRADIVTMIMPNTPETVGFMDARRIGLMKDGALLINCGRGNALDPDALYDGLVSGKLEGAAVDVTYVEPLPAGDRLWSAPNLIITPHIAGGWNIGGDSSPYMAKAVVDIFMENLQAYLADAPMPNAVDLATGYTKKRG